MTYATGELKAARNLLLAELDMHPGSGSYPADLDPGEVGIVADAPHAEVGTSYHLGKDQLRADAYSARTTRDGAGLTDAASAVDVGEFKVTTPKGTFTHRDLALWSVAQCQANHPDTRDIREVIYSPDGVRVFRYDRERGITSKPAERIPADNHRWHNHYSQYRDATKAGRTTLRDHFARWLTEIGLGDDMAFRDDNDARALMFRVYGMQAMSDTIDNHVNNPKEPNELARTLRRIEAALTQSAARESALAAAVQALADLGGADAAPIVAAVNRVGDELGARIAELDADNAALRAQVEAYRDAEAAGLRAQADELDASPA
jgi:hypothetical protein